MGEHGEAYADERIATFLPAKAAWLQLEKESHVGSPSGKGFGIRLTLFSQVFAEQIAVRDATAVAVARNVNRVIDSGNIAHAIAERIQTLNRLAVSVEALKVDVGLQAARAQ